MNTSRYKTENLHKHINILVTKNLAFDTTSQCQIVHTKRRHDTSALCRMIFIYKVQDAEQDELNQEEYICTVKGASQLCNV